MDDDGPLHRHRQDHDHVTLVDGQVRPHPGQPLAVSLDEHPHGSSRAARVVDREVRDRMRKRRVPTQDSRRGHQRSGRERVVREALAELLHSAIDQCRLRTEVSVNTPVVDVGSSGDLTARERRRRMVGQQLSRYFEQPVASPCHECEPRSPPSQLAPLLQTDRSAGPDSHPRITRYFGSRLLTDVHRVVDHGVQP